MSAIIPANEVYVKVKTALDDILDIMNDGDRTTLKDLVDKIVYTTNVQVSMVNGLVPMMVHQKCEEGWGTIRRGRAGGIVCGALKVRIDPRPRCGECHQVLRPIKSKMEQDSE